MRKFVAALAVVAALTGPVLADTGPGPRDEPATAAPTTPAPHGPSADVLIQVKIVDGKQVGTALGSGVYLGDGKVITDLHVVNGAKEIVITLDRDGVAAEKLHATIDATDATNDLALLHVVGNLPAGMKKAELACRRPWIGEPIEVVGNPLGVEFVHSWGRVAGVARTLPGSKGTVAPIDVEIASGNSGGPVYDSYGKVLGLAEAVIPGDGVHTVGRVDFMTPLFVLCKDVAAN